MEIDRKELEKFISLYVAVGVDHLYKPDDLFFFYGKLKKIGDSEIKLETKKGIKLIKIKEIREIYSKKHNVYNEYYGGNQ
ncbi:MAG: hypothetical protein V5A68_06955 [Candidatus Thermoplasmatota archaeon]